MCRDVVNCFQTLYLWPTDNNYVCLYSSLRPVVNCFQTLYLWPTDNNQMKWNLWPRLVVNCFQTLYLWPTDNNGAWWLALGCKLWIAFKLYIFDLLITILLESCHKTFRLWIAFKLYIFDLLITMEYIRAHILDGCELLSNFISLTYW